MLVEKDLFFYYTNIKDFLFLHRLRGENPREYFIGIPNKKLHLTKLSTLKGHENINNAFEMYNDHNLNT